MNKNILFAIVAVLVLILVNGVSALDLNDCTDLNNNLTIEVDFDDNDIKPGDEIGVEITFENNHDDMDIEDIEYEIWFEDSGGKQLEDEDEDDIEEDDDIDVDSDDDEKVTYSWAPNQDFDDGDEYFLVIMAKGEDKDDSSHIICAMINQSDDESITFERESHKLEIYKATASVTTDDECKRKIKVEVAVRNIGDNDEDEVILTITNDELGIDKSEELPELDKDYDDDDNDIRKDYTFSASDIDDGTYSIDVEVEYRNGREKEEKSIDLEIGKCELEEEEEEEEPEVIITQPTIPTGEVVAQPTLVKEEEPMFELGLVWIVLAYVVVLVVGIALIIKFLKK